MEMPWRNGTGVSFFPEESSLQVVRPDGKRADQLAGSWQGLPSKGGPTVARAELRATQVADDIAQGG